MPQLPDDELFELIGVEFVDELVHMILRQVSDVTSPTVVALATPHRVDERDDDRHVHIPPPDTSPADDDPTLGELFHWIDDMSSELGRELGSMRVVETRWDADVIVVGDLGSAELNEQLCARAEVPPEGAGPWARRARVGASG